jgi:hypothetical protein
MLLEGYPSSPRRFWAEPTSLNVWRAYRSIDALAGSLPIDSFLTMFNCVHLEEGRLVSFFGSTPASEQATQKQIFGYSG